MSIRRYTGGSVYQHGKGRLYPPDLYICQIPAITPQFHHYLRDGADVASMLQCFAGFASFFRFGFRNIVVYIYLYLYTFILERFVFFCTKGIVQAYV